MIKNIETGVDRLISLIQRKRNIDLDKAANELGISESVIREWAEFLEEEGMISMDYGLSRITLSERKLSKKETESRVQDFHSKKDAFVRKVETTIKALERETEEFNLIKNEFSELQKNVGTEMQDVKKELDELRHYEDLKKNIDNDIRRQKQEYIQLIERARQEIKYEENKYSTLLSDIGHKREELSEEKKDVLQLEEKEDHLRKRLEAIYGIVKSIENQLGDKEKRITDAEKQLTQLQTMAIRIEKDIRNKKKNVIEPLIQKSEEQAEKISIVQDAILQKMKHKELKLESYSDKTKKLARKFEKFFDKKMKIGALLTKIDDDKHFLEDKLRELIRKVQVFNVLSKDSNTKEYMEQLVKNYGQIDNKRAILKKKVEQLGRIVRGD